jgi:SAM-dependent methyltransferase
MKLSLFTPTHRSTHLLNVHKSIREQAGVFDWEWIIVPNGKEPVSIPLDILQDRHVCVVPSTLEGIGALKRFACGLCKGDILVEMDHDDTIIPTCFAELANAYHAEPEGFYYSDFVNLRENGTCETYSTRFGWEVYAVHMHDKDLIACHAFPPSARALCQIFYAPNHIRAWSRTAYERAGGHDATLSVGDDHDLLCRTYIAGAPFVWIPKPLYIYRRWNKQSFVEFNKEIQIQQRENCNKYLHQLIMAECQQFNYPMMDIGRAEWCPKPFTTIDWQNLTQLEDNSVGCIRAFDAMQRIPRVSIVQAMNEMYRVLRPGGWLMTRTPSVDDGNGKIGRGAFQDPSHCSYWSENSFQYFTQKKYAGMLSDYHGRFQEVRRWTDYPSDEHRASQIPYVHADLCALKGQRQPGSCDI